MSIPELLGWVVVLVLPPLVAGRCAVNVCRGVQRPVRSGVEWGQSITQAAITWLAVGFVVAYWMGEIDGRWGWQGQACASASVLMFGGFVWWVVRRREKRPQMQTRAKALTSRRTKAPPAPRPGTRGFPPCWSRPCSGH